MLALLFSIVVVVSSKGHCHNEDLGPNTTCSSCCLQGSSGSPGLNGRDGTPGINGINGVNGRDCRDGAVGPPGPPGLNGSTSVIWKLFVALLGMKLRTSYPVFSHQQPFNCHHQ